LQRQRGWLAGCHMPMLYQNGETYLKTFSTIWVAPSFWFLLTPALIPNSKGTPSVGAINTRGVGKIGYFRRKSSFILETVRDRPMVAMER